MEYGHEQAVADGVNVDFDVYRIRTEITEQGSTIEAGLVTQFRDRETRAYALGAARRGPRLRRRRSSTARSSPRTRSAPSSGRSATACSTEIFPGRTRGPEDADLRQGRRHADDIVADRPRGVRQGQRLRREDHLQARPARKPEDLLAGVPQLLQPAHRRHRRHDRHRHRREADRVRVFMRMVKTRNFFEQMKGRGVRVINDDRPPGGHARRRARRTTSCIVDAVGVTETELIDTIPLERKPGGPAREAPRTRSPLGDPRPRRRLVDRRPARPPRPRSPTTSATSSTALAGGRDAARDRRAASSPRSTPTASSTPRAERQRDRRARPTTTIARPRAHAHRRRASRRSPTNPELREQIVDVQRSYEQVIDETSQDDVTRRRLLRRRHRPRPPTVESFGAFLDEQQRRDHRPPGPLQPPHSRAAHLPRGQGARRGDRAARRTAGRPSGCGRPTRRSTRSQGPRLRPSTCSPTSSRSSASRSAPTTNSSLPGPGQRALRRLAPPAGERGPVFTADSSPGSTGSATTSPPRSRSRPTTSRTRRSSRRAGSAGGGGVRRRPRPAAR